MRGRRSRSGAVWHGHRASEDGRDELLEHVIGHDVWVGGALEGEAAEGRADRSRQDRCGKAELEAERARDALERLGERLDDGIATLCKLLSNLGVADAERPELVEEQRPVRIPLK